MALSDFNTDIKLRKMVKFGVVNEIKPAIFSSCLELGINRKF